MAFPDQEHWALSTTTGRLPYLIFRGPIPPEDAVEMREFCRDQFPDEHYLLQIRPILVRARFLLEKDRLLFRLRF